MSNYSECADKIEEFINYLSDTKKRTNNTLEAYKRDLLGLLDYMNLNGIDDFDKVSHTNIMSYILYMEKSNKSVSSITRSISSMKTFFHFMLIKGYIKEEPTEMITAPKPEKKQVKERTSEDTDRFLKQIKGDDAITLRDKAMFELMCSTGMRVGEIIDLKVEDINLNMEHIICRNTKADKVLSIKGSAKNALSKYIDGARNDIAKLNCENVFVNCRGKSLSRQGFWKIFKDYAKQAGLDDKVSPDNLRHVRR